MLYPDVLQGLGIVVIYEVFVQSFETVDGYEYGHDR